MSIEQDEMIVFENKQIAKEIKFDLFGQEQGTTGIKISDDKFSCPFAAMVCYNATSEQIVAMCEKAEFDAPGLQGGIIGVKLGNLKDIIDIGRWGFGFLGEVTPKDEDQLLVFIITDSEHVIWINTMVE